jgi:hypothetical protein
MVTVGSNEHLRLVPQAAESDGVDDPVAVALEQVARTAGRPILFCEGPAARL